MIGKVAFEIKGVNAALRPCNAQQFRKPTMCNNLERISDSFMNVVDGYKPVVVKGIDKVTGKKRASRDEKGRKLINWIRTCKQDGYTIKDILNFNGTKIIETRDINNQLVEKYVEKGFYAKDSLDRFFAVFENGEAKYATKRNGKSDVKTFWLDKKETGKWFSYRFFHTRVPDMAKEIDVFCEENCPELIGELK